MTGRLKDLTVNRDGTQNVTVTVACDFSKDYDKLKDHELSIEIKKAAKGRSLNANAFMWSVCTLIGNAMTPPLSKEDVYRMAVEKAGVYWQDEICVWDIEKVRNRWVERGTGWLFEIVDDAPPGKKLVHLYFGTSTYTVDEMKTLLDWLVDQAEQMELKIPLSKKEEEELLERWGKK